MWRLRKCLQLTKNWKITMLVVFRTLKIHLIMKYSKTLRSIRIYLKRVKNSMGDCWYAQIIEIFYGKMHSHLENNIRETIPYSLFVLKNF